MHFHFGSKLWLLKFEFQISIMHNLIWFHRKNIGLTMVGVFSCFVLSNCFAGENDINKLKGWLSDGSIVWSAPSNGFWTGLNFYPKSLPSSVSVLLLSSNKLDTFTHVFPPERAFQKIELRDSSGALLPLRGQTGGKLLERISASTLPHSHDGIFSGRGTWYDYVIMVPNEGLWVKEIKLNRAFKIQKEGIYSMIVCPSIYQFETNREYLDRVDLPCVTAKVYLRAASDE